MAENEASNMNQLRFQRNLLIRICMGEGDFGSCLPCESFGCRRLDGDGRLGPARSHKRRQPWRYLNTALLRRRRGAPLGRGETRLRWGCHGCELSRSAIGNCHLIGAGSVAAGADIRATRAAPPPGPPSERDRLHRDREGQEVATMWTKRVLRKVEGVTNGENRKR